MRTFITGDRTPTLVYPGMVATEMLRALGRGDTLATGDQPTGVEDIVRRLAEMSDVAVEVVPTGVDLETQKPAWDERHQALASDANTRVVAIHVDPHSSSVLRSLVGAYGPFDDDRLNIVSMIDAVA